MSIVDEMKPHVREYMEQRVRDKFEEHKAYFENGNKDQSRHASENLNVFWSMLVKYGIDINEIVKMMNADDVINNYKALTDAGANIDVAKWFPRLSGKCAFKNFGLLLEKDIKGQDIFDLIKKKNKDIITEVDYTCWLNEKVDANDVYDVYEKKLFVSKDPYKTLWKLSILDEYGLSQNTKNRIKEYIREYGNSDLFENIAKESEEWGKLGVKIEDYYREYIRKNYSFLKECGPSELIKRVGMSFEDFLEHLDFEHFFNNWYRNDLDLEYAREFVDECLKETGTLETFAYRMTDSIHYTRTGYSSDAVYYALLEKGGADCLNATEIAKAIKHVYAEGLLFNLVPRKEVFKTFKKYEVKRRILRKCFPKNHVLLSAICGFFELMHEV